MTPDKSTLVYIVEDDTAVLKSLCALLHSHDFKTIACETAEDFLQQYNRDLKSCLILDIRLPGMSGMELQAYLNRIGDLIPIIVVTGHGDIPLAVNAIKSGAIDFIEKPTSEQQLLEALKIADDVLNNRVPETIPNEVVSERLKKLTQREREVLGHLVLGKINKEIAEELGVSRRTIEIHRARIREKMVARGVADLIRMLK